MSTMQQVISILMIFITFWNGMAYAYPRWRSSWDRSYHDYDYDYDYRDNPNGGGCTTGTCMKIWECPKNATALEPTGECSLLLKGTYVCCSIENKKTDEPKPQRRKPTKSWEQPTESYSRSTTKDPWHRSFVTNSWNKITQTPWYVTSKNPWEESSEMNSWKKTTKGHKLQPTSASKTSKDSKYTPSAVDSWKKTNNWHSTTKNPWQKPSVTNAWDRTTYRKTTKPSEWKTSETYWNKYPSTTNLQKKPTKSYFERTTTRRSSSKRTTMTWNKSSTNPRYTTSTNKKPKGTTPSPWARRPLSTTILYPRSTNNQARDDTFRLPPTSTPRWTATPKYKDAKTTKTTMSTTRRYGTTTPLPDINSHVCGLRDVRTTSSRRRMDYDHEYDAEVIFPDANEHSYVMAAIVGGKEAEPFSWPWVAALYKVIPSTGGTRFLAAGSLINEYYVLTAAHVFKPDDVRSPSFIVKLGTHTKSEEAVAAYTVASILQHPKYQSRYYYHDIALLRLKNPVEFNSYVMPLCLPSPEAPLLRDSDLVGKRVTVLGWGDDSFGGYSSRVLREATFPIVSRRACNQSYVKVASNSFPKGITNNMLCAGAGGKDACQGDSGGPLTVKEDNRYTQVGIVSFGYKCGDKEYPGVYTRVAPYLTWIAQNTVYEDYHGRQK